MGSYRSYMRDDYQPARTSPLTWLICAIIASFIVQKILLVWLGAGGFVAKQLALSPWALSEFKLWTPLSYSFLHDPENLLHILFSVLSLYFIGREVLAELGSRRFFSLYAVGAILGGLAWAGVHWSSPQMTLVGASAAISAIFIVYTCLFPDRPITFLLLFIPITLPKTKYLAYGYTLVELIGFFFSELPGNRTIMAHSAHLGGMLAGLVFFYLVQNPPRLRFTLPWSHGEAEIIRPSWTAKAEKTRAQPSSFQVNVTNRGELKAEVDRILDKITSTGFGSLTPQEKKTLDEARDLLSK